MELFEIAKDTTKQFDNISDGEAIKHHPCQEIETIPEG